MKILIVNMDDASAFTDKNRERMLGKVFEAKGPDRDGDYVVEDGGITFCFYLEEIILLSEYCIDEDNPTQEEKQVINMMYRGVRWDE